MTHQILRRPILLPAWVLVAMGLATSGVGGVGLSEVAPLAPGNQVANGDFSASARGTPPDWSAFGDRRRVKQELKVVLDGGNPCARLACIRFEGAGGPADHAMLAQVGVLRLREGELYEFSCRARAEDLAGHRVRVRIQDRDTGAPCGLSAVLTVTRSWQSYRRVFRASRSIDVSSRLQLWFGETGVLYVDDVSLTAREDSRVRFTQIVPDQGSVNLVPNGSFELGEAGWASLGTGTGWGDLPGLHGDVTEGDAGHGRYFLRIPLGGEDTPVLQFDYPRPGAVPQHRVLAASRGWIPVRPDTVYTVSCLLRSNRKGTTAVLGVRGQDPEGGRESTRDQQQVLRLELTWKRYAFSFHPEQPYVFVTVGPDVSEDRPVVVDVDAVQLEMGGGPTPFQPRLPLECAVVSRAGGGVSIVGEPGGVRLLAYNDTETPQGATFEVRAADGFDAWSPLASLSPEISPRSPWVMDVPLPETWRGYYKVHAAWNGAGETGAQDIPLAVVPPRRDPVSFLGVNHAFSTATLIRRAGQAGVSSYRDWSFQWDVLEPDSGRYVWAPVDAQVDRLTQEGMALLPLLPPFPSASWNSEAPAGTATEGPAGFRRRSAWAPRDLGALQDFVGRVVTRYRDRVQTWEFLNEPIYSSYALPGRATNPRSGPGGGGYEIEDYVRLLAATAAGMKRSDPECRIVAGVGGEPGPATLAAIRAGCLRHADILNLHIYPGTLPPEEYVPGLDRLRAAMAAHGGEKPIWITEFSYYGTDTPLTTPAIARLESWVDQRLLPGERACAELTVRFLALALAHGVERVFLHSGATGSVNNPEPECCLFGYGGAPTRVFAALAVLTDLLGAAPRPAGTRVWGKGAWGVAFETPSRCVLVLWSTSDEDGAVDPPPGLVALDLMGREISGRSVPLSSAPVFVVGAPGRAREVLDALTEPGPRG